MTRHDNRGRGRSTLILCGVTVPALALAACGSGGGDSAAPGAGNAGNAGGTYSVGVLQSFASNLAPGAGSDSFLHHALFTPLTSIDPSTKQVTMAVAESVDSPDRQNWTIKIKKGWTFSDGSPVTAGSFADAWNAAALGANGWIGNSQMAVIDGYPALNPMKGKATTTKLSGLQVVDDQTLKVKLSSPNAMFPYMLSSTNFAPIPKSALTDLKAFNAKPVGNGPFSLQGSGVTPGAQSLTLVRNDAYAGTKAKAKQVDVKLFQDPNALYTSFQGNALDVALVDGTNLADAKARYANQLGELTYPAVVYLGFPMWDKRFQDVKTRRAMAQAIDRTAIADGLLRGSAQAATSLAPSVLRGADQVKCDVCTFDAAKAKSDLGTWSGPLKVYTTDDPAQGQVITAIANGFRSSLGIPEVTTEQQPISQLYTNLGQKKIDGPFLLYTGVTYPHLYTMASNLFGTSFFNVTGYTDKTVNAELAKAAAASDPATVDAAAKAAAEKGLSDVSLTPVYFPRGGLLHSDKVDNIVPEFLGGARLADVVVK